MYLCTSYPTGSSSSGRIFLNDSQERHRNQAVPEQGTEGVLREDLRLLPVRLQPVPQAEVLPVRGDVHELRPEAEVVQGRVGMA